ncbi:unnamed protein product [Musa acuminata var. zebrina]
MPLAWRCMYTRAKFLPKDDQLHLVVVSEHTGTLERGLAPSFLTIWVRASRERSCTRKLLPRPSSFFSFPSVGDQPQQYPAIRADGDRD